MTSLPTLRRCSAALVLTFAVLSLDTVCDVAVAQGTPAAATTPTPAPVAAPAETAGDAGRGLRKAATCLGCHAVPGYKADFPVVYSVPMLGGQNAKYIEAALKEYQKGDRRFPSMMATAKSLSDQDIADLAAFFSSQH